MPGVTRVKSAARGLGRTCAASWAEHTTAIEAACARRGRREPAPTFSITEAGEPDVLEFRAREAREHRDGDQHRRGAPNGVHRFARGAHQSLPPRRSHAHSSSIRPSRAGGAACAPRTVIGDVVET